MRVERLSNHAEDQLQRTHKRIAEVRRRRDRLGEARRQVRRDLKRIRRTKPWWKRVFRIKNAAERTEIAKLGAMARAVFECDAEIATLEQRSQQQAGGLAGEDALLEGLARLSNEWTVFTGYRNRRGEADAVLLGPDGLWLVEVKRRRIILHVSGEDWHYEKLDRYGNVVASGPAVDGGGRNWGRQVSDVADDLDRWLARNSVGVGARRAVAIMHADAAVGRCRGLNVDLVTTSPRELLKAIRRQSQRLGAAERERIADLIRRDHAHHARRTRRKG